MSKLWARFSGIFSSKAFVGIDKTGNRYFARTEPIDGVMKEKRWVKFKGEDDPTSIPVEWICWLNGQRKKAPTPEEMVELEAKRERLKMNVALLKKEEEERKSRVGKSTTTSIGKAAGPDLKSFVQQFPTDPDGKNIEATDSKHIPSDKGSEAYRERKVPENNRKQTEPSEPIGSGESFRPGTWQPPT